MDTFNKESNNERVYGDLIFGQKTDEDIICYAAKDGKAIETIIDLNEQLKFHCYGLLQQVDNDFYAIIMD